MGITQQDVHIQVFLILVIHMIYVIATVVRLNLHVIVLSILTWKLYALLMITLLTAAITLVIVGKMSIIWQLWELGNPVMKTLKWMNVLVAIVRGNKMIFNTIHCRHS